MREPRNPETTPEQEALPAMPTRGRGGSQSRTPEVEIAIGHRLRAARITARMSQGDLGAAVGISFQQVQKYENGKDRVAASTLQGLAAALGVHPGTFFGDDLAVPVSDSKMVREAMAVAADWQRVKHPETRKGLAKLVATLAGEHPADPKSEG